MNGNSLQIRHLVLLAFGWAMILISPLLAAQDLATFKALEQAYQPDIYRLLKTHCHQCHSDDKAEAEINLATFTTIAEIRQQPKAWLKVRAMLDSHQMPPKDTRQPTDTERQRLQAWVRAYLTAEAKTHAGDPGPIVLRRLNNSEYNYTVQDLTGVVSLNPTREFPVDGAAGEGFTNAGAAQGMSPALVSKYLDAAKDIATHAVLTPEGIRFSTHTTRRDQTDELLARIQAFYRNFTRDGGGSSVNLQGITFNTNQGGLLPLSEYLAATLIERKALENGIKTLERVAQERNLNTRYLELLWMTLSADKADDGSLLGDLRAHWRATTSGDPAKLVAEIEQAQKKTWKFNSIGHLGREGSPSRWMEAVGVRKLTTSGEDFKWKLPTSSDGSDVVIYLTTNDAGDGNKEDYVTWKNFRLEGGDRPPLKLSHIAGLQERIDKQRVQMLNHTTRYLAAATAATGNDIATAASEHDVNPETLKVWLDYLAIGQGMAVKVEGHFTQQLQDATHKFIKGWGTHQTPSVIANSSDQEVRIPGLARAHSVVVHPSPTLFTAVGWQSPIDGIVRIEASVTDAHDNCGNGVEWFLQHRNSHKTATLWKGEYELGGSATMTPRTLRIRKGELLSLLIGPRQGNHGCDLTSINLTISEAGGPRRSWNLAKDVSADLVAANPHTDRHGNPRTWHFYKGEMTKLQQGGSSIVTLPPGSILALWLAEKDPVNREKLGQRVQELATGAAPSDTNTPDATLYHQLRTLTIPVDLASLMKDLKPGKRFGRHPLGQTIDSADLAVHAPEVIELRIPAELARGRELVGTVELDDTHGREGTVQVQVLPTKPTTLTMPKDIPILIREGSSARERVEGPINQFCNLFPPALCYARIVPVDEVVTLTLFHREDDHLRRLMLDEQQEAELDRLWNELYFVSQEPLKLVVAFEQISEFATQDRPDLVKAFKPLGVRIKARAELFRKQQLEAEPVHIKAVLELANQAWRRPLTDTEQQGLRRLYRALRSSEIAHEEAIQLTIARILTSPSFLYRKEQPAPGSKPAPISNLELANRLSYFLWASMPDADLQRMARTGQLTDQQTLVAQARRMLDDDRTRRLAVEFACQWLHVRNFDQNQDKNEKLYPQFATLRGEMYEETVRFFEDMFRNDRSVLDLLDANHTFLNESLAKHYGIDGISGPQWRRVDGIKEKGRGGVLGMATVLASQSGASRTSPILRGNWVFETLLGERLPRPPANVPDLPNEVPSGLTARQLIEKHSSVAACAKCHARIDPYGFALEQYDAIGRFRPHTVNTKTRLPNGKNIEGIQGLRDYLAKDRRDDLLRQFCRKLLGYALGREVQLSDEPLLASMQRRLASNKYRFSVAIESIVTSPQFLEIRGTKTGDK